VIFTQGLWLVKSSKIKMVALGGFFGTLFPGSFPSAMGTRLYGGILPSSYSPLSLACVQTRATKKAGDVCTQAAFHSVNMPISPWLPWPCAPLNWHNSPEKDGVVGKLTSPLFGFWQSQSRLQSLIPLQWKGQPGSWPKVSQSLGTRLLPGLFVHCRQVESSLLGSEKEVQTGWLRS